MLISRGNKLKKTFVVLGNTFLKKKNRMYVRSNIFSKEMMILPIQFGFPAGTLGE